MGKNKHKNKQKSQQPAYVKPSVNNSAKSQEVEKVEEVYKKALENTTDEEQKKVAQESENATNIKFEDYSKKAFQAFRLFEDAKKRVDALEQKLEEDKSNLEKQKKDLTQQQSELERNKKSLVDNEREILFKESELQKREKNAEADFAKERRESTKRLDDEAKLLQEELSSTRKKISEERTLWIQEQEKYRNQIANEFQSKEKALHAQFSTKEKELEQIQREINKSNRELQAEKELFEEDKVYCQTKARLEVENNTQQLTYDLETKERLVDWYKGELEKLKHSLTKKEENERRFGHKTVEEILQELIDLQAERDRFKEELATRPSQEKIEHAEQLSRKVEEQEKELTQLKRENNEMQQKIARYQISVVEIETLREQKYTVEKSRDLIQASLEDLRKDVDERIRKADGKSPFPSCSQMDNEPKFQEEPDETIEEIKDLKEFVSQLQHRMATAYPDKKLFYSLRDIRSFLGGLAMSRLHLLQGISGIGKTSLPLAFAKAIQGGNRLIEVQAGWRDRQDLIGHFNSFESRFYETEFLQALYLAGCPAYKDLPFIIILDEMNLSHPEQYFADFLSALEQPDKRDQKIELMTASVDPSPKLLIDGKTLSLPKNVWFIGTANHDETTKDFADKTYDRSHVMELPRSYKEFAIQEQKQTHPLSYSALMKSFKKAQKQYEAKAQNVYKSLEENFKNELNTKFRIGWGNRLKRQMEAYVSVIIATGGNECEALDHILETKILRKLKSRYDTRSEDLKDLQKIVKGTFEKLDQEWVKKNEKEGEIRSINLLQHELQALGSGEEDK